MKDYISGKNKDDFNSLTMSSKKLRAYNIPYQYCIICKADSPNSFDTMICNLLLNIQQNYGSGFQFKIIEGYQNYYPPSEEHLRGIGSLLEESRSQVSESHVQNKKLYAEKSGMKF